MASQELTLTSTFPLLHSSARIPILGFGIYGSTKPTTIKSCLHALKTGYRHIDGAQYYRNELEMGEAARQSKIPRDQVFLTTKIISPGGSPENTYRKCLESVKTIGIGEDEKEDPAHPAYVDLFLVHTPNGGKESRKEMWLALERLQKEGRARSIGVSNFGVSHVEEMKEYASAWPPAVNQIEVWPPCPPIPTHVPILLQLFYQGRTGFLSPWLGRISKIDLFMLVNSSTLSANNAP